MTHPLTLVHTTHTVRDGLPRRSAVAGTPSMAMAMAVAPGPASPAMAADGPTSEAARAVTRPTGDRPAESDAPAPDALKAVTDLDASPAGTSVRTSDHDAPVADTQMSGPDHDASGPRGSVTRPDNDAGMSTVEYAVGTVVAAAFAAVLYRIVTGDSIVAGLTSLVQSALNTGF